MNTVAVPLSAAVVRIAGGAPGMEALSVAVVSGVTVVVVEGEVVVLVVWAGEDGRCRSDASVTVVVIE